VIGTAHVVYGPFKFAKENNHFLRAAKVGCSREEIIVYSVYTKMSFDFKIQTYFKTLTLDS